ncbi:hypothetical protein EYF80_037229 [Liparis tanakae]|uniref:Uncharacterized protein n=1 Tax=Liparis tanakae TaxID=230148 RepID=A0A4Z2GHF5_9TELE|nr:hypothetical protein EYF80_037229 [Liparis tanakae]
MGPTQLFPRGMKMRNRPEARACRALPQPAGLFLSLPGSSSAQQHRGSFVFPLPGNTALHLHQTSQIIRHGKHGFRYVAVDGEDHAVYSRRAVKASGHLHHRFYKDGGEGQLDYRQARGRRSLPLSGCYRSPASRSAGRAELMVIPPATPRGAEDRPPPT